MIRIRAYCIHCDKKHSYRERIEVLQGMMTQAGEFKIIGGEYLFLIKCERCRKTA